MSDQRPASMLRTCEQWAVAAHVHTTIDGAHAAVTLDWEHDLLPQGTSAEGEARGLAFDRFCRLYRSVDGNVERVRVGATAHGVDYHAIPPPTPLFGGDAGATPDPHQFAPVATRTAPFDDPAGVAVDVDDRLFVAERGAGRVLVYDLWSHRLLRAASVRSMSAPDRRPRGIAAFDRTVWVVVHEPGGLLRMSARRGPEEVALPPAAAGLPADAVAKRVTVLTDGTPVVLFVQSGGSGWIAALDGGDAFEVGYATDLTVDADGVVVIAGGTAVGRGGRFARVARHGRQWFEATPLDGSGYDGTGIARTSDGRIGYWTSAGFRLAIGARVRYATAGQVVTYRLDSSTYQNRWGRLFLDACIPLGTDVSFAAVTSDDDETDLLALARTAPAATPCDIATGAALPPMPPAIISPPTVAITGRVHRRETGSPLPWWRPLADDPFDTFEAPLAVDKGRYLWIALQLSGDTRSTPRVRAVRAEHEAHSLLRRLPRVFSADPAVEDFLYRYLAIFDGFLDDLSRRAHARDLLIDPASVPQEALDWLGSFVGMVLDDRWPLAARRQLVAEAMSLWRARGTLRGLSRYLEIYLGVTPVIIEAYRLRGLGGPVLDSGQPDGSGAGSRSVLGGGFRVGGPVGAPDEVLIGGGSLATAYDTSAHRFSVLIPRTLDDVAHDVVLHVLETQRPAHTLYELCTVDAGMRVGRGLHLGLSSVIGCTGGFDTAIVGQLSLGRGDLLGRPEPGAIVGNARTGLDSRVG